MVVRVQFSHSAVPDWDLMGCSTPGLPVHHKLLEPALTHVHWVGDAIPPSHPLLPLPSIFPSIRVFSNESALHIRCPKYWSFSFSISPSNDYSGLISFRMDWLDLLAVQGTLKSLNQHHSSKASMICCLAFFMVQLSHPWLQSPYAVILESKKIKSVTFSIVSPSLYHEVMGPDAMVFVYWMLSFKPAFSLSSLTFIKRLFSSSSYTCQGPS